jgi:hypothetical protein
MSINAHPPAVVDRAALARILEQSIPYVVKDEFHPVLYEAMSGLHQYVGIHLSRLKPQLVPRQPQQNGRSPVVDHHHEVNHNNSKPVASPTTPTTTMKLNHHTAANGGGLKHHSECAVPSLSKTAEPSPPPPPTVQNTSSAKEPTLQSSNDTAKREKQSRWFGSLKKEKPVEQKINVTTEPTNRPNTGTVDESARKEKLQQVKTNPDKYDKLQTETSRQSSKSMAEQRSVNYQQLQEARANALKKETPLVVQSPSRPQAIPSTTENIPVEVRLEQEKRQAAERHRRNVELQRKLSRAEWKTDDLAKKLKYLANEERKLTLVVSSQQQPDSVAAANAAESLRQTETQMASIQQQLQEQEMVVAEIKAELQQQQHHHHQEETVPMDDSQSAREIAVEQKRRHEAHRKLETDLEARKKAAAEQRRKELEEERQRGRLEQKKFEEEKKRQFLEQEQRKQDLMNSAKVAHGHKKPTVGEDNALLEKLSNQVSAFDHAEDIHRSDGCADDAPEGRTSPPQGRSAANNDPACSDQVPAMNNPPASHHQHEVPPVESTANNFYNPGAHEPNGPSRQPPPQPQHHHDPSGIADQKYTQTSKQQQQQEDDDEGIDESSMAELKRGILLSWALQPPNMQTLRPIGELLATIHHAFPPAHDLPRHDYFDDWQPLSIAALASEPQLNKAVRKVRFFLHPDKRPRDLSDQHQYLCKLLWDVTNDAWEEYLLVKDELGWMND